MRYIASYLLANLGGVEQPSVADISKILSSIGVACEESQAKAVVNEMNGKVISEVIAAGASKLASVPAGGAAPVAASGAAASSGAAAKEETKKAEAKKEESDEEMGFGLFD